jgi:DNA-binding IclR family transcriptional regulator
MKGDVIKEMNEKAKRFCNMRHGLEIICEKTMLPKQTVNNVVKKLAEQGYLALCEQRRANIPSQ